MKWRPDAAKRAPQPGLTWDRGRPAPPPYSPPQAGEGREGDAGETPAVPGGGRVRRIIQSLLYGRGVDRARKAQARLGLALFGFVLVYAIIAGRLVLYGAMADTHMARRGGSTDAVATARPDILDRNGEILATDLKTPSLFAEPRRIIDPDEATELLAGVLPDLDSREVRERLGSKRGFA